MRVTARLGCWVAVSLLSFSTLGHAVVGQWERKADIPTARWAFQVGVFDGRIAALGRQGGGGAPFEVYDSRSDTFIRKADMPTWRGSSAGCALDGKLYVIGGWGEDPSNEAYDPVKDTWSTLTPISVGRAFPVAEAVNGKIYAIGGFPSPLVVEEYDPSSDTWTRKSDPPVPLSSEDFGGNFSFVDGDEIVVSAPHDPVFDIYAYHPASDTWTPRESVPFPPTFPRFCEKVSTKERLYVTGGFVNQVAQATVYEYDYRKKRWSRGPDMLQARGGHSAGVTRGKLYVISGYMDWNNLTNSVEALDIGVEESRAVSPDGRLPVTWSELKTRQ